MTRLVEGYRAIKGAIAICMTLIISAIMALPGGATACACGEFKGPIVAHGKSLYGVPWHIRAALLPQTEAEPRAVNVSFSIPSVFDVGWSTSLPLPISRAFVLEAITGTEVDPYPESNLSGVVGHGVVALEVAMDDGSSLAIEPVSAPHSLHSRFPWLRRLRFFDEFFPSGPRPKVITALNRSGVVVARGQSDRGGFRLIRRPR